MVAVARRHLRSTRRPRSSRGLGGSSSIDSVVLRDRDMDDGFWWTVGDGDLEERRYYCQNWRADVSVILPSTGCDASSGPGILEWIKYSAYGVPQAFSMADYNRDGVKNSSDYNGSTGDFDVDYANSDPRADLNFDGGVTIDDLLLLANAASEAAGRGTQSCASVANRIGYAGYVWDPAVSVNHVRHRVYVPELGRWTRRDPLGYVDGMGLYEYVLGMPMNRSDPTGQVAYVCALLGAHGSIECDLWARCVLTHDYGIGPTHPSWNDQLYELTRCCSHVFSSSWQKTCRSRVVIGPDNGVRNNFDFWDCSAHGLRCAGFSAICAGAAGCTAACGISLLIPLPPLTPAQAACYTACLAAAAFACNEAAACWADYDRYCF